MSAASQLPAGLRLIGDVTGVGDLVVRGRIDGEVHVEGRVDVERGGVVRGDVRATAVTIGGELVGVANATEHIRVLGGAVVVGDLRAPRVDVAGDADVRGHVARADPRGVDGAAAEPRPARAPAGDVLEPAPRMPRVGRLRGRRRGRG